MPELAKVEQIRGTLEAFALHRKIIKVYCRKDDKVFCYKKPDEIEKALLNKRINKVCRKGKHLWFELNTAPHIAFHFGMTGKIKFKENKTNSETEFTPSYWKLQLQLDNNGFIAYTTKQRLGKIRIHNKLPQLCEPIKDLGYDPQHNMCTKLQFIQYVQTKKKKSKLKPALMDQHFICGIGSWIADEICYQSGIFPNVYIKHLTETQLERIYDAMSAVCKYALSVNGEGIQYPSNWLFHYRWSRKKENCIYDGCTQKITFIKVDSRRTAVVYDVQSNNGCRTFVNDVNKGKITNDETNMHKGSDEYKKSKANFKKIKKNKKNKNKCFGKEDKEMKLSEIPKMATKQNTTLTPLRRSKRLAAMQSKKKRYSDESSSDSH